MASLVLSLFLFLIFIVIGGFHFYWLFGGIWGLKKVIPTKNDKLNSLKIPIYATLMVGIVLLLFGVLYFIKSGLTSIELPNGITNFSYWFIPVIFILRAIGEFNYVGFFKKINNTEFSKADSKIFSPLCLIIGITGIIIQLINN